MASSSPTTFLIPITVLIQMDYQIYDQLSTLSSNLNSFGIGAEESPPLMFQTWWTFMVPKTNETTCELQELSTEGGGNWCGTCSLTYNVFQGRQDSDNGLI